MTDEEQTCGKGLAEHSAVPRKLGAIAAAMAEVLDHHRTSLDLADPGSRPELDAYTALANQFRDVAKALDETAGDMAGYRDLPMANHDESALMSAEGVGKFETLVRAEQDLLEYLKTSVEQGEAMLSAMRGQ